MLPKQTNYTNLILIFSYALYRLTEMLRKCSVLRVQKYTFFNINYYFSIQFKKFSLRSESVTLSAFFSEAKSFQHTKKIAGKARFAAKKTPFFLSDVIRFVEKKTNFSHSKTDS